MGVQIRDIKISPNERHITKEYFENKETGYTRLPYKTEEFKIIGAKKYKWNYKNAKWIRI